MSYLDYINHLLSRLLALFTAGVQQAAERQKGRAGQKKSGSKREETDADEPGLGVSTAQSSACAPPESRHTYTHAYHTCIHTHTLQFKLAALIPLLFFPSVSALKHTSSLTPLTPHTQAAKTHTHKHWSGFVEGPSCHTLLLIGSMFAGCVTVPQGN